MEVVKITRKVYKVRYALQKPFDNFGKFKRFREARNMSLQEWTCCFNCGYKFKDEDDAYLVWLTNTPNRFFCKECNDKALLDLSKEVSNEKDHV